METQNQIKRTLSQPEAIKQINSILDNNDNIKRTKLADIVCDQFSFFDPRGERQRCGCLKALRELEQKGGFVLPKSCHTPCKIQPRRLAEPVPEPMGVPDEAGEISDLRLILVKTEEHMRIWNELMIQDHPRGAGPLVGRQLRYLAESGHGWLGGFGFSSAALHLEDRDRWIGWDWDTRRANLHHVVNMSRFLIRSSISCKNLASRLLGIDAENWTEKEFGGAPLGDKRLSQRLVEIGADKAEKPGCAYSGVAKGDWPKVKAYYRLIDKPDDSAVTMANIILPHREQTIRRMKAEKTVLCVQDGSDLNYSSIDQCEGLGVIGTNQTGAISSGLHLHSTLALTTEGLPLGVLRAECTAPKPKSKKDKRPASAIPIEEKKTFCWIEGVRDCMGLKAQMPHTSIANVMDREADFFEMFDDQRCTNSSVDLLVRAKHNSKTTEGHKLFETARQSPIQTRLKIKIPRQSARPKKSKQKARPKRSARTAEVSVRYVQVKLNPPPYYKDKDPIVIWVIHVEEDSPPVGTEPLEWFLLTTIDIKSADDAVNCVEWYCLRWRIEDWHRVLKSGCGVEDMAHKTAERLKRAIAINLVIAWRIMLMTLLGRETPELPPEVLFSDLEIEVLKTYAKKKA